MSSRTSAVIWAFFPQWLFLAAMIELQKHESCRSSEVPFLNRLTTGPVGNNKVYWIIDFMDKYAVSVKVHIQVPACR